MSLFKKVSIVGVGLIGGSIGLDIKNKKIAEKVIGIGHRKQSIQEALEIGAIDGGYLELKEIKNSDLVILAAPVRQILNILPKLHKFINRDCVVIDVGSTKSEIIKAAKKSGLEFVGCHPLAGMEKKGPQYAKMDMFSGSLCILVPLEITKKETLNRIRVFWNKLGADTKVLDAKSHDRILSLVSHLPHIVAFALISCIKENYFPFGSGGLKDTTRIAMSSSLLWRDIFLTNRKELMSAIRNFKNSLSRLEFLIKHNRGRELAAYLKKASNKRNEL